MANIVTSIFQRPLPPIPDLIRLTLKVIYDKKRCTDRDISDVPKFIERYYECVKRAKGELRRKFGNTYIDNDTRAMGTKGTVLDETEFWISWCAQRLVQDEENSGEVARNKRDILVHGTDYRKLYRLPEAYTAKDFARAMSYLKKAMMDHPEDYN